MLVFVFVSLLFVLFCLLSVVAVVVWLLVGFIFWLLLLQSFICLRLHVLNLITQARLLNRPINHNRSPGIPVIYKADTHKTEGWSDVQFMLVYISSKRVSFSLP